MLKLMQLKYPTFPGRVNTFQASVHKPSWLLPVLALTVSLPLSQTMYRDHCYYATDYTSEIRAFADASTLAAADRIIQFPFVPLVSSFALAERRAHHLPLSLSLYLGGRGEVG